MSKRAQPNRIVRTASGNNMRSTELRQKIQNLLEQSPHLSNRELADRLGVSRTTAGKYAAESRRLYKSEKALRRRIKVLCNSTVWNPVEIARYLKKYDGFENITSPEVRRIMEELQRDGIIRNKYAESTKIVFDRGTKREINTPLDIGIYSGQTQAYWYEVSEIIRKREIKLRYLRSAPGPSESVNRKVGRTSKKRAQKHRKR